jgi:O-antigen biosynthesis protein
MAEYDSTSGLSIIVLTWNGIELVKECVSQVIESVQKWPITTELIIADNGSQDGSVEYIRSRWPDIKVVAFDANLGFACANNRALSEASHENILFLNNDLILEDDFILPLMAPLADEKVFAVAPKMLRWDRTTIDDGLRYGEFFSGLFDVKLEKDQTKVEQAHYVTFFCGACFVCKKSIFLELGGFDELYTPYAWEDLDLGYRAWKRGFRVVYEPRAVCYHKREATTRNLFSTIFFVSLMWRNKFFFIWKNITYRPYIRAHILLLPVKLVKFLFNGRWRYVIGFCRALWHLPAVLKKRRLEARHAQIDDRAVLKESYVPIRKK